MNRVVWLRDGSPGRLIVPNIVRARLSRTCFRGREVRCAGNFSAFATSVDLFHHRGVTQQLLASVQEDVSEDDEMEGKSSVTISTDRPVGWASTNPRILYPPNALEMYRPRNRNFHGLRVRTTRADLLAPRVSCLTVVYTWQFNPTDGWLIFVGSIYPGEDIGELEGDITAREGVVFFDWDHPGA